MRAELIFLKFVTIVTEMRLSTQNWFFFGQEKSLFTRADDEKSRADRGFLAFLSFENERKFRRKRKNVVKNLKFSKKWVSTRIGKSPTKPWNIDAAVDRVRAKAKKAPGPDRITNSVWTIVHRANQGYLTRCST